MSICWDNDNIATWDCSWVRRQELEKNLFPRNKIYALRIYKNFVLATADFHFMLNFFFLLFLLSLSLLSVELVDLND